MARILSNPKGEPRTQHARAPLQMLDGTITPNAMHFTILHSGIPDIDPAQHRFVVHGMVKQALEFTVEDEGVFTMPWSATITYGRNPNQFWDERV